MAGGVRVWCHPCTTKLRAYFSKFCYRSSCNGVKLRGVLPVFGIINTSFSSVERYRKSGNT
jgi:hypothetical protein